MHFTALPLVNNLPLKTGRMGLSYNGSEKGAGTWPKMCRTTRLLQLPDKWWISYLK